LDSGEKFVVGPLLGFLLGGENLATHTEHLGQSRWFGVQFGGCGGVPLEGGFGFSDRDVLKSTHAWITGAKTQRVFKCANASTTLFFLRWSLVALPIRHPTFWSLDRTTL
jgi:hypothetical protein